MTRRTHLPATGKSLRQRPSAQGVDGSRLRPAIAWASQHEDVAFLVVSAAWVLLLYWRVLRAPFVYDDLAQIVHNPNLAPWSIFAKRFIEAPVSFTGDLGGTVGSTYRPLYWLTMALDLRVWGLRPMGFHATNLVLHLANGFLGFRLLRRLSVALPVAAATSLVWLGLPINSEVVAWVSGRSYALCGVFVLVSLLAAVAYRKGRSVWLLGGYVLAAIAALLSNELGILVLPLTALVWCAKERFEWRAFYSLLVGSLIGDGGYLALARGVGAHAGGAVGLTWSFGVEFWRYVEWIALPVRMSVERSTLMPVNQFSSVAVAAWVGVVALCAGCVWLRKRLPGLSAGVGWMTLGLLPFCGLVTIYAGMAERFVYLASAGMTFAVVALVARCRGMMRTALIAFVAAWVLWGAWRLHERVLDWCDPVALYSHSLEANPDSASLNFNLAFSLRQEGDLQGAAEAYRRTIELQRSYPHALTSLGEVYLQMGQLDNAERQFVRAIAVSPTDSSAYTNLGVIFSQRQLPRDAARMFSKAIENNATDATPYFDLAVIFQQAGHGDMALPLYKKALELQPGDPDTLANMRKITAGR